LVFVPVAVTVRLTGLGVGVDVSSGGISVGGSNTVGGIGTIDSSGVGVLTSTGTVGNGVSVSGVVGVAVGGISVTVGVPPSSMKPGRLPPSGVSVAKLSVGRATGFERADTKTLVRPRQ
jgi:hypothetical protein